MLIWILVGWILLLFASAVAVGMTTESDGKRFTSRPPCREVVELRDGRLN